jgi:hypothetical protein
MKFLNEGIFTDMHKEMENRVSGVDDYGRELGGGVTFNFILSQGSFLERNISEKD